MDACLIELSPSLVEEATALAEATGMSLTGLVNAAVEASVQKQKDLAYLRERAARADPDEIIAWLESGGGGNEPPREGDELPPDWKGFD